MLDGCTPWPEEFVTRYRTRGYWRGETLGELPRQWARQFGGRTALVHNGVRVTYEELDERIDRRAAGFRRDIAPGDRVVLQLPNVPEFVIVCFALYRLGAKPVFSLTSHRGSEIRHLCATTDAVGYVVPGQYRGFDYAALGV